MDCSHPGPCEPTLSASICALVQRAHSVKYSVNDTWQFAEISPYLFALYNPVRRELVALGTLEEILASYRARQPFAPIKREEVGRKPTPSRFQNIKVNI
jgi:hypothetical protein